MTAQPTDADRATARELALLARSGTGGPRVREEAIAQALADVRQPFLDLADDLAQLADELGWARGAHYADAADQIRAAATRGDQ